MKKYELTNETKEIYFGTKTLYRIKALKDFAEVKKGDLGGWVEKEDNLSQVGLCWVADEAMVFDNARVFGNAIVYGNAKVYGNASVFDNAIVNHHAVVCGYANVYNNAFINDFAQVYGNATVFGYAQVYNLAIVYGKTRVFGNAMICGEACICGVAIVDNEAVVRGNATISENKDYVVFRNFWCGGRYFTWTRSNNMWCVDWLFGTGQELIDKAYEEDGEESSREYQRIVNYVQDILGLPHLERTK